MIWWIKQSFFFWLCPLGQCFHFSGVLPSYPSEAITGAHLCKCEHSVVLICYRNDYLFTCRSVTSLKKPLGLNKQHETTPSARSGKWLMPSSQTILTCQYMYVPALSWCCVEFTLCGQLKERTLGREEGRGSGFEWDEIPEQRFSFTSVNPGSCWCHGFLLHQLLVFLFFSHFRRSVCREENCDCQPLLREQGSSISWNYISAAVVFLLLKQF